MQLEIAKITMSTKTKIIIEPQQNATAIYLILSKNVNTF